MEEILKKYNYISTEFNTWTKNDWTIRLDKNIVEVFNDPDKASGIYYIGPIETTDIEQLLTEIE